MRCIFKILPIAAKTRFPFKNDGINRMLTIGLLSLTAATSLYSTEALASQLSNKADSFLSRKAGSHSKKGWTSVIVKFKGELTAAQKEQMKSLKADVYRHLDLIHSAAVSVPTRNLQKLSEMTFVEHLSEDVLTHKCDEFIQDSTGAGAAFAAPYNLTGSGIGVAVVDSGVGSMAVSVPPDMSGRTVNGPNFAPGSNGIISPGMYTDTCGHGTHVAGIIAGNGQLSSGTAFKRHFYGVARSAKIIGVRVLDNTGAGTVSNVISGILWCVTNKTTYNIRVINLSLGHDVGESYTTDPLCQAVESAWNAGIVVVCAAGNTGRANTVATNGMDNEGWGAAYGSIQSPGNDPFVITVGAMKATDLTFASNGTYTHNRNNDHITTYSSRGPTRLDYVMKPDIIAPGNKIISTHIAGDYLYNLAGGTNQIPNSAYYVKPPTQLISTNYFMLSGTSMATPVVSGAAALMLQKDPTLTPATVKARLMISADKWGFPNGTGDPCTFGAGYLNIISALNSTAAPTKPALSPSLTVDLIGNAYVDPTHAIWGLTLNGEVAIWGVSGLHDLRIVWGQNAIQGGSANTLDSSHAIWGSNVWNEHAIWGTNVWNDHALWGVSTGGADLSTIAITGE